jgi:esterase/lipase
MELIGKINTGLLVMATKSDEFIPYTQAIKLYEESLVSKDMVLYQGALHDLLYNLRNYHKIMEWLDK